jgi:hypothetical protein
MAAKNLNQALTQGICVGRIDTVIANLKGEVQDYLSHELMKLQADYVREGRSPEFRELADQILVRYFERVNK